MAYNDDERDTVIKTAIGEAVNQGYPGMVAVMETIRNRSIAKGKSPKEIALAKKQYSFWNNRLRAPIFIKNNMTPENYQVASKAFEDVFYNNSNTVGGSTHYHALPKDPYWVPKGTKPTAVVGQHKFYSGIK